MERRNRIRFSIHTVAIAVLAGGLPGCQSSGSRGGGTQLPADVVVWGDPEDLDNRGRNIRDVDNVDEKHVLIGTDGSVQFSSNPPTVCNDCEADIDNATIDLGGGNLIDLRFGTAPGSTERRPFLVDRATGNFIRLVEQATFQVRDEPFEDPDDSSDDLAVAVDETANPAVSSRSSGSTGSGLCGALGTWMIPMSLGGMLLMRPLGRRW